MTKDNKPQGVADIVGLPDEKDKENILIIIKNFEKENPGVLVHTIESARRDFKEQGFEKAEFGVVNKAAQGRIVFELPQELAGKIEEAYPFMFRDKKHFAWFVQNFKALMIPAKY